MVPGKVGIFWGMSASAVGVWSKTGQEDKDLDIVEENICRRCYCLSQPVRLVFVKVPLGAAV